MCKLQMPKKYVPNPNLDYLVQQKQISHSLAYFFQYVVDRIELRFEEPETQILVQGDQLSSSPKENFMFFIERGHCRVKTISLDIMKDYQQVNYLSPNDYFGEIALIFNSPRTFTVETHQYTTLGALSQ